MREQKCIALIMNDSWDIKNYVLAGVIKELARKADILVMIPDALLEGTRNLISDLKVSNITFVGKNGNHLSNFHDWICKLQKAVLYTRHDISTIKIIQSSESRGRRLEKIVSRLVKCIAGVPGNKRHNSKFDGLLDFMRKCVTAEYGEDDLLAKHHVDLVFFCNPLYRHNDPIYYASKKLLIPIATSIHSWDNLTSKGQMQSGYDRVFVWNDTMKEEVLSMYPRYKSDQITKIGVPRFSIYKRPLPTEFQRGPFIRGLGLNPDGRVMLFTNSSTKWFPNQPQVIGHICEAMQNGEIPSDVQLLIRCHPHDESGPYEKFRSMNRVALWPKPAEINKSRLFDQIPPLDDLWVLSATMKHCSLCFNPASTMMLEAAACDVPIINIAYDGDEFLPYNKSIVRAYDFSHQLPLKKYPIARIAGSRTELIECIKAALADPSVERKARAQVSREFLSMDIDSMSLLTESLTKMLVS